MRRFLFAWLLVIPAAALAAVATYGLSLYGDLKYGPDFTHFDYADPNAPQGGTMHFDAIGTFGTLNPFVISGVPSASGIGLTFDRLAAASEDEPASEYGLVAKSIEVAPDKRSVLYVLHPSARFHDGTRITPEDVIWTFETLRKQGLPDYRAYYAAVEKAEKEGEDGVRFVFKTARNRELAQIIGEMPVLSKAYWSGRDFTKTTLQPPLGSGPYEVASVQPGQSITYKRVKDYWGRDLPVNKGRYNLDQIRYDYYRDNTIALEAFKAGQYDIRVENAAKDWATGYDSPAVHEGLIKKVEIPNGLPSGMQGFGYNLRRPIFADRRVREALAYAYDFNWENKALFYGEYTRTRSYFDNSELAATGLPQGEELKILEPFRAELPKRVFTEEYDPPQYKNPSDIRAGLETAVKLLKAAGWEFKGERLVNDRTGAPFSFEILLDNPQFERIVLPFVANLRRIGITARVRTVDTSQFQQRMNDFDYDMTIAAVPASLSPGNEEREYWGSAAADEKGSSNILGVKSEVVDRLVEELVNAPDRASLVAHTRALDRVLQWGFYVIPQYHISVFRVAYWDKFGRPAVAPKYGLDFNSWWVKPGAEASLEAKKAAVPKE